MAKKDETRDEVEVTETTTEAPENTTENLDGGPEAEDALGVKKNIVGPNHDELPADNSPTTQDVAGDADTNLRNAREEGFQNGLREKAEAEQSQVDRLASPEHDDRKTVA